MPLIYFAWNSGLLSFVVAWLTLPRSYPGAAAAFCLVGREGDLFMLWLQSRTYRLQDLQPVQRVIPPCSYVSNHFSKSSKYEVNVSWCHVAAQQPGQFFMRNTDTSDTLNSSPPWCSTLTERQCREQETPCQSVYTVPFLSLSADECTTYYVQ